MVVQNIEKVKGTNTHSLVKVGADDDALQTYRVRYVVPLSITEGNQMTKVIQ